MSMPGLMENGRWRGLVLVSFVTLIQGAAAGAAALATRGLFEAIHAGQDLPYVLIATLAGSGLLIAAARVLSGLMGERLGQDYALSIRLALLDHAARMPASAVATRRGGYMSLRFVGDMTAFRNWLGKGLPRLIAGAVMIPAAGAVLWVLEPRLALSVAPILGLTLGAMTLAGPRLEKLHRRLRARRARIAAEMAERMPLAPELDRMGRRPTELRSLRRRSQRMINAALHRLFWAESLKALPDAMAGIAACAILLVGAQSGVGTGTIAGALAAIGLLLTPLRDLASLWNFRAAHLAARRKCAAALSRDPRDAGQGDQRLPKGPVHVLLRDLPVPHGRLSLEVAAGQDHCLTCEPGDADALFSALCGLERVPVGHVKLSGVGLTDLSRGTLRRGVVQLDSQPLVLKGSLRRNLGLGLRQRPTDRTLKRAARKAGLGDLLSRRGGLNASLAEGARDLSARERSALSLARLLLAKPQLVLLGDAMFHIEPAAKKALAAHIAACEATILRHPVLDIGAADNRALAA